MKYIRFLFIVTLLSTAIFASVARAQSDEPQAVIMTADGPIMPPMLEYIKRGIEVADRRNAEVLVIQLNTPGGSIETMLEVIREIRASNVPVVVYVAPKNAIAGSAGGLPLRLFEAAALDLPGPRHGQQAQHVEHDGALDLDDAAAFAQPPETEARVAQSARPHELRLGNAEFAEAGLQPAVVDQRELDCAVGRQRLLEQLGRA